eukprot:1380095-Rhodomonas_salina.1
MAYHARRHSAAVAYTIPIPDIAPIAASASSVPDIASQKCRAIAGATSWSSSPWAATTALHSTIR